MTGADAHLRATPCCAIDQTAPVEDYLKTVFALTSEGSPATTSGIAHHLGVTPSSASIMVARLRRAGLVDQAAWGRVRLSRHGMSHARSVVRRHRLVETLLHRLLGLGWDEIHHEAEILEHSVSERVTDLIDEVLGHPVRDPHGDPIPAKCGPHIESGDAPLRSAPEGSCFVVRRVLDRDSGILRRLADLGVRPGVKLTVAGLSPRSGGLHVHVSGVSSLLDADLVDAVRGDVISGDVVAGVVER